MGKYQSIYDIEREYCEFMKSGSGDSGVEYIGVNLYESSDLITFKRYYMTARSLQIYNNDKLLQPFFERNMVRALNKIEDNISGERTRYEIGLANRNNENMYWLYKLLLKMYPALINREKELIQLSRLKCSNETEFKYAAMYFLGIIVSGMDSNLVEAIKFHYLLRKCDNPDSIGRNYSLCSEEYLKILMETGISAYKTLIEIVKVLLENERMELWMAAVDYFQNGSVKYKIYLKKKYTEMYEDISRLLSDNGCGSLSEKIVIYSDWLKLHPELEEYGLALCLSEMGEMSVNFYH